MQASEFSKNSEALRKEEESVTCPEEPLISQKQVTMAAQVYLLLLFSGFDPAR